LAIEIRKCPEAPHVGACKVSLPFPTKPGEDPTEPPRKKDSPFPPISHEPRIKEVFEVLKTRGLRPYPAPMGVRINEAAMHLSPCVRCDTCDGYPCLVQAKSDSEVSAVLPVVREPNVTLVTEAKVLRLHTNASGREVTGLLRNAAGSMALKLMFREGVKPIVLVYWAAGKETAVEELPDNARLLGALSNRTPLALPADARGKAGRLVLYSLADHEMLALSNPVTFWRCNNSTA